VPPIPSHADARGAHDETASITPYRDGPYLVRGAFRLLDQHGREIAPARRTIALCRCGRSQIRPLCDGTHRAIGFRAPGCEERYDGQPPVVEGM
jgi:CDGSH-type Zn-finger protein